jgi:hypothetical protein
MIFFKKEGGNGAGCSVPKTRERELFRKKVPQARWAITRVDSGSYRRLFLSRKNKHLLGTEKPAPAIFRYRMPFSATQQPIR